MLYVSNDNSNISAGGPVYLYISGETSGPSRFSNLQTGIIQILMEATNGLGTMSYLDERNAI